ncbi:MAG: SRPBCC family protein [Thermoanaerobaculia bacterium]
MAESVEVRESFTILRPQEELYSFWKRLENLPRFMRHVESVESNGGNVTHWRVRAAGDREVEWDAEIVEDDGQTLAWRTLPDSEVEHGGSVTFRPATGRRGTVVTVSMAYRPPAGKPGLGAAKLLGKDPENQVRGDLRRFKQLVEAGEIPTTEGQTSGRNGDEEGEE